VKIAQRIKVRKRDSGKKEKRKEEKRREEKRREEGGKRETKETQLAQVQKGCYKRDRFSYSAKRRTRGRRSRTMVGLVEDGSGHNDTMERNFFSQVR
jgi:hypothetical protein